MMKLFFVKAAVLYAENYENIESSNSLRDNDNLLSVTRTLRNLYQKNFQRRQRVITGSCIYSL